MGLSCSERDGVEGEAGGEAGEEVVVVEWQRKADLGGSLPVARGGKRKGLVLGKEGGGFGGWMRDGGAGVVAAAVMARCAVVGMVERGGGRGRGREREAYPRGRGIGDSNNRDIFESGHVSFSL